MDADGVAMGPRHICMHPSGRYAYVNNEIGSAVTPVKIDAETGGMSIAVSPVGIWVAFFQECQR